MKCLQTASSRLYEKSIQNVQKLNNSMNSGYGGIGWSQKENDSVHTGLEISDLFANLDCSSKDAFMADFNAKLLPYAHPCAAVWQKV